MITVKDLIKYRLEERKVGEKPVDHWAVTDVPRVYATMFEVSVFANEYTVLITGNENTTDWRAFWQLDVVLCFVTDQAEAAKKIAVDIAECDPLYLTLWNVETGNSADWICAGSQIWKRGYVVDTMMKKPNWEIKR